MDGKTANIDCIVNLLLEKSFVEAYLELLSQNSSYSKAPANNDASYKKKLINYHKSNQPSQNEIQLPQNEERPSSKNAMFCQELISETKERIDIIAEERDIDPNESNKWSKVKESPLKMEVIVTENLSDDSTPSNGYEAGSELELTDQSPTRKEDFEKSFHQTDFNDENSDADNGRLENFPEKSKITHSTPVKGIHHDKQSTLDARNLQSNPKLSSNLAVMVGDLSGIHNDPYADEIFSTNLVTCSQLPSTKKEDVDTLRPSTLVLSDFDTMSLDSYKVLSSTLPAAVKSSYQNEETAELPDQDIIELQKCYEKEIRRLQLEKDELAALASSPKRGTLLGRLKYVEEINRELEQRCLHTERRNRQLTLEVDRLSRSCFEIERRARVLESDKTLLQERNFKLDQERRKSIDELSALQERLSDSMSSRRLLEDELIHCKKKEFDSSTRLSDSDTTIRELKEELNSSKNDCTDKDQIIRNISAQKREIQENLNQALEQIEILEDASSQRAREKNLFHKLLEEYELLYTQHRRIRSLYNEAVQRLDDGVEDNQNRSPAKGTLTLNLPTKNSSLRKKWNMSPTSPSIREQDEVQSFPKKDTENRKIDNYETSVKRERNRHYNRHSTGSILSWESPHDYNNNEIVSVREDRIDHSHHSVDRERRSPLKWFEKGNAQHQEKLKTSFNDSEREIDFSKHDSPRKQTDWVVQNLDGITRFDVVFSSPKQRYEQAERDVSSGPNTKKGNEKVLHDGSEKMTEERRNKDASVEIMELENDLKKLSAEKNEIESQLSRLPINGSGRSRRSTAEKQELLEERLDEVVKYIGNIRMALKRHKAL